LVEWSSDFGRCGGGKREAERGGGGLQAHSGKCAHDVTCFHSLMDLQPGNRTDHRTQGIRSKIVVSPWPLRGGRGGRTPGGGGGTAPGRA